MTDSVSIDEAEISYVYSRSPGPGGQNVNKVATKATLLWSIPDSRSLNERQCLLIMRKLAGRINREGVLRVSSSQHRTQAGNRAATQDRLVELVRDALHEDKPRKATRPTRASAERRLKAKQRRTRQKRQRGGFGPAQWD